MLVVLEFNVADVQKTVSADTEIDKGSLNRRLDIDHATFVDVADVVLEAVTFDVKLFENPVLHNGDPTFLWLEDVDQHFLLHRSPLFEGKCEDYRLIA